MVESFLFKKLPLLDDLGFLKGSAFLAADFGIIGGAREMIDLLTTTFNA